VTRADDRQRFGGCRRRQVDARQAREKFVNSNPRTVRHGRGSEQVRNSLGRRPGDGESAESAERRRRRGKGDPQKKSVQEGVQTKIVPEEEKENGQQDGTREESDRNSIRTHVHKNGESKSKTGKKKVKRSAGDGVEPSKRAQSVVSCAQVGSNSLGRTRTDVRCKVVILESRGTFPGSPGHARGNKMTHNGSQRRTQRVWNRL